MTTQISPGFRERSRTATNMGNAAARVAVILGIVGGVIAVIGATMPWLSFFAGLQAVSGLSGVSGWTIAGLGVIAAAGSVVGVYRRSELGRWISGLAGFGVLAIGAWTGVGLIETANSLAHDPLLVSSLEPGLLVASIGGGLAFAVLFIPGPTGRPDGMAAAPTPRSVAKVSVSVLALASTLGVAAVVHLLLAPEHGRGSLVMGMGFVAAGLGQAVLAVLVLPRRRVAVLALTIAVNVVLVAAYVLAVTVGLPLDNHSVQGALAEHGALGHVEAIDSVGALTVVLEILAVGLAVRHLRAYQGRDVTAVG